MRSEVRIDGEMGIDDITAGAADAPRVGMVAAQRNRVTMLVWEREVFWLLYKRLEAGTFAVVDRDEINARELYLLLEGIEAAQQRENAALRQRVQLLTHRHFGPRSETGVPVVAQGVLPFEPAAGQVQPETTDESQRDETSERGP